MLHKARLVYQSAQVAGTCHVLSCPVIETAFKINYSGPKGNIKAHYLLEPEHWPYPELYIKHCKATVQHLINKAG